MDIQNIREVGLDSEVCKFKFGSRGTQDELRPSTTVG